MNLVDRYVKWKSTEWMTMFTEPAGSGYYDNMQTRDLTHRIPREVPYQVPNWFPGDPIDYVTTRDLVYRGGDVSDLVRDVNTFNTRGYSTHSDSSRETSGATWGGSGGSTFISGADISVYHNGERVAELQSYRPAQL